eukprot:PhM_4_TR10864/c0_g1_i1/m.70963/K03377/CASD1; N-acetylneuraminate 9-O-acetyltransferase
MRRPMTQDQAAAAKQPDDNKHESADEGKDAAAQSPHTWLNHFFLHAVFGMATLVVLFMAMNFTHNNDGYRDLSSGQLLVGSLVVYFGVWWLFINAMAVKDFIVDGGEGGFSFVRKNTYHHYLSREDGSIDAFNASTEFFGIILLFWVCDRTPMLTRTKKHYDSDTFWFLWFVLMVAAFYTLKKAIPKKTLPTPATSANQPDAATPAIADDGYFHVALLQRDQTEEWKGWMQVMFLWYHYFHAVNLYNAIRLYIAAYVWMTGFGNFSYYYIRKDFSLMRFLQMQWRLNFFVIWCCLALENEYMLYYICMLHTTFTVMIYAGLGICSHVNQTFAGITMKIIGMTVAAIVIWDLPRVVFDAVWFPVKPLVEFHDPYKPTRDPMHEWYFRSGLDHLIWIVGMLTAYNHPRTDAALEKLDQMPPVKQYTIKWIVVGLTLAVSYVWYENVFALNKFEYNKLHPYTSWIPITAYIILRNIFATARQYHLHLFEFLGKITLETYIAQFHIWMATTGPNGSPKKLLAVFPKDWPLMNFAFFSILYTYISFRIFHSTNTMKSWALPMKDMSRVKFFGKLFAVYFICGYILCELLRRGLGSQMGWSPKA